MPERMIGADVVCIEQDNFSPEEAATPESIAERLKTICDTFLIAEIDGVVAGYIERACDCGTLSYR